MKTLAEKFKALVVILKKNKSMRKIDTILILAGGDGTRFWPLPQKNLTKFLGKPLIQHVIESLTPFTNHLVVVSNSQDKKAIEKLSKAEVLLQDEKHISQAGAILAAENSIKGEVLIVNANDIFNPNIIPQLISRVAQKKLECVITAKKVNSYFPGGYLILKEKKLGGIIERPGENNMPSPYVRLVVDYFADFSRLLKFIKSLKNNSDDGYEQALNSAIKTLPSDYLIYEDYWFTIKYPWHVLTMMSHFLDTLEKNKIKIGKNVKMGKNVRIIGPTYIDDGSVIGDFVMIRGSHIGKNCLIGGYCEITRSYVGDNVQLHRNYVGDSILGNNSSMGAGAATANFRFDSKTITSKVNGIKIDTRLVKCGAIVGDFAKIGVNVTLLPGVKVGSKTFVGPGTIVTQDIPNNLFVFKDKIVRNKI